MVEGMHHTVRRPGTKTIQAVPGTCWPEGAPGITVTGTVTTSDQLPVDVLLRDLAAGDQGAWSASAWAWEHRWQHLPTGFGDVETLSRRHGLDEAALRQLTLASARRIHYAFAFTTLQRFCRDALDRFPDEELLLVLASAAGVALGSTAWLEFESVVRRNPAEGISRHVLLTAVYLAAETPRDVLERALILARELAAEGDLIALYRSMSILRRLGRYTESLEAGMRVNDAIATGRHPAELCDHLSERVLVERHLTVELMALRGAHERDSGLPNMGL